MRITLFALLVLGLSTAPAFAGARIHRLYHAPLQPQRAVLQKPHTLFHEPAAALPGKTIPMLPTSRPLPPSQPVATPAEPDVLSEPPASEVGAARTLPIIPVTAQVPTTSPSEQPVLIHPRTHRSEPAVAPVVVPVAAQLTAGTVHDPSPVPPPAPAPKPTPQPVVTPVAAPAPTPQPVAAPVAVPKPLPQPVAAPVTTPAPTPTPAPRRRLPIAPVS